jgi:hypothetical protein
MFGHLWSLAIEEQFYVIWPVVMALIAWRSRNVHRTVIIVCVAASVLSLAQMIRLFNLTDPTRVYVGTDTRASSLLLGALFATAPLRAVAVRWSARLSGAFTAAAAAIAVVIGLSWILIDGPSSPWLFRGGLFAHSLLAAVLVAGCAARPDAAISRGIGWTPIRVIGVLSYSLYLWHWPIYALLSEERTGMSGWPLTSLRIGLSIIAAAISKQFVEDPIRFRATWARGRAGVMTLIGVSVLVGGFWVLVPRPAVAPAVFSLDQFTPTTVMSATTGPPATMPATTPAPAVVATPVTTPVTTGTTTTTLLAPVTRVLMVGDSLAFDEWPAVAAAMYAGKVPISSYVSPGAGLLDTRYKSTLDIDKAVVDFQPDLVLYQGSLWDFASPDQQRVAYQRFTDMVLAQGARLAFITIPPLRADQQDAQLDSLTGIMKEMAAEHPGQVVVLNSDEAWGPEFTQDVNGDKVPERKPDGAHVCPSGAAMYAVWLTEELEKRFAGFIAAPPSEWAAGDWVDDPRYINPAGICAAL